MQRIMQKKGYRVKKNPAYTIPYAYDYAGGLPVDGSEETALRLVQYAMENPMNCAVHYCSLDNKLSSQIFHQNKSYKPTAYEMISQDDFFSLSPLRFSVTMPTRLKLF